jgi:hypothetical protein
MKDCIESIVPPIFQGWKSMYTECGHPECRNSLLMRGFQSRVGVAAGKSWYCGVDCFARAMSVQMIALSMGTRDAQHIPRVPLELILLSKGYLTDRQLKSASLQSEVSEDSMETILLRLGMASERQIAVARSAQWGYPVLTLDRHGDPVRSDLPRSLLRSYCAVPIHQLDSARRVLVGFVYRVEHSFLSAIEEVTNLRAEPCFITAAECELQINRLPSTPDCEEVMLDADVCLEHLVKIIGGFAVDFTARDARIARCRDHVWLRLLGKRRRIDLLLGAKSAQPCEGK